MQARPILRVMAWTKKNLRNSDSLIWPELFCRTDTVLDLQTMNICFSALLSPLQVFNMDQSEGYKGLCVLCKITLVPFTPNS